MSFAGKVALVTGAAGGIGQAVSLSLLQKRTKVLLADCRSEPLERSVEQLQKLGHDAHAATVDLNSAQEICQLVQQCEAQLGPIDYLVHAAGRLQPESGLQTTQENWNDTFSINARAVFILSQQVALQMRARRRGAIVTVGSNAGAVPRAAIAAYAASKAAAASITRSLGLELAPFGVRCNIVSPGSTHTAMLEQLGASDEQLISGNCQQFRLGIPLARIATPLDIANSVVFLLSDEARHITLHDLRVDGGATLDA